MLDNIDCYICLNISNFNGKLVIVKPLVEFNLWMHYLYTIIEMLRNKIYQNFQRNIKNISYYHIWSINNCFNG